MTKKSTKKTIDNKKIAELKQQLVESLEREKRALADYQNLVKRNQEERIKFLQLANQNLIETLLSPLEHLSLAAEQIEDQGLNMVIRDFWQVLEEAGVEEIYPKGEKFDLKTMEVIDKEGDGQTVVKVAKRGYRLNGQVIQHAKVIVK
jgi:molecular chaperone GrpE